MPTIIKGWLAGVAKDHWQALTVLLLIGLILLVRFLNNKFIAWSQPKPQGQTFTADELFKKRLAFEEKIAAEKDKPINMQVELKRGANDLPGCRDC